MTGEPLPDVLDQFERRIRERVGAVPSRASSRS